MFEGGSESPTGSNDVLSPNRRIINSYACMIDLDEGTSLKFIQTSMINGVKCAKIEKKNDVNPETAYWQFVMLCLVLGSNPPLEIIKGFIRCTWKAFDIHKICLVRKGVYLVRINSLNDQMTVVQRGVYFLIRNPSLLNPRMKRWILTPRLSLPSLFELTNTLRRKTVLKYARLLIEIHMEDAFPEYIDFINDHNVLVRQKMEYEWKPTKCSHLKKFGHTKEERRKKSLIRKEWRLVYRQVE
ncbi:hypothetical protein Cgig2_022215 [Carnegiea gigantea]|uniref:Uncharacterized protein n=1 Tax=Carnegiea gigantea TaxID=171969 RepID=A0A9Q1GI19_9CARY|nr:hypothetical protein Cgig2_022215 [Carnegiea gigantea]